MIEYLRNSANFRGAYDFAVDAAVPCQNENHIESRLTTKTCTCLENTPNRLLRFPYTKFFKLGRLFMKKIILSVAALALGCSSQDGYTDGLFGYVAVWRIFSDSGRKIRV